MNENKENIIVKKSYAFASDAINLYKYLIDKKEVVISKQILKCGTSIGENIHVVVVGESKKVFSYKSGNAVTESRETSYWLNLLMDSSFTDQKQYDLLNKNCIELPKILNSIILTTKESYFSKIHNS